MPCEPIPSALRPVYLRRTSSFTSTVTSASLSFAVRELSCSAGICITASHNPSKYNGYKVYNKNGSQIVSPEDELILNEIDKIKDIISFIQEFFSHFVNKV